MSYRIELTRGSKFSDPGAGISREEWEALLESDDAFVPDESGMGVRLCHSKGRHPVVWDAGVIYTASPDNATFDTLVEIATSIKGRLFGEDGDELGLSMLDEVRKALSGFNLELDALDPMLCRDLMAIGDPSEPPARRLQALAAMKTLEPAKGRLALTYLLVRAVECSGDPEDEVLEGVVILYHHDPARVRFFQGSPMDDFIDAVNERFMAAFRKQSNEE